MQVTETSADGLKREFTIVVPAGELEEQITHRLDELGRSIRLPGFRPGKVPQQLLRRRYGPAIRGEVLEHTVQDSSAEAMREQNLRPALPPRVEIVSASEGADLEYKMSVELLPEMPQPDFPALGLERLTVEVPDADVDEALKRMAEQFRKSEPVERGAQNGDILVVDVAAKVGDQEIPGTKGEGRQIEVGAEGQLPGFSEQLSGVAAGESRAVSVTLPEDYGNPEFAGKEAVFDVAVKEVRERQPAVVDDKLAEEVGLENLGELRDEMRERIARDYSGLARQRLKRQLLDKLDAGYSFPVPPGMVEIELNNIWAQHRADKAQAAEQEAAAEPAAGEAAPAAAAEPAEETAAAGDAAGSEAAPAEAPVETTGRDEDDEELKAEYQALAERRVRLGLLLAEVGRNANISVTQDELNQAVIREAQRFPGAERQVLDYYRKNPDAAANLRAPIFEEKVVDHIVELAQPTERKLSPQELLALAEAEEAADNARGAEAAGEATGGAAGEQENETEAAPASAEGGTAADKKPRRQSRARGSAAAAPEGEDK